MVDLKRKNGISRWVLFLSCLLLAVCTACSSSDSASSASKSSGKAISFSGAQSGMVDTARPAQGPLLPQTVLDNKSTLWEAGDSVGIYCAQAETPAANAHYTADSAGQTSSFSPAEGHAINWGGNEWHYFYSYYPYSAANDGKSASSFPIPDLSVQTQVGNSSAHVGNYDFLIGKATAYPPDPIDNPVTVDLKYEHVFTLLKFRITSETAGTVVTKVKLAVPDPYDPWPNIVPIGNINLTQSTPATGSPYTYDCTDSAGEVTLNITGGVTLTDSVNTTPVIYMLISPTTLTSRNITITITSGGNDYTIIKKGADFKRGYMYVSDYALEANTNATGGMILYGKVKDADDNEYKTVTIGTQTWMAESLRTTKYRDGTDIPLVTDAAEWAAKGSDEPAMCWYNNDKDTYGAYGALYNLPIISLDICPAGFKIPQSSPGAEYDVLRTFLGGAVAAGNALRSTNPAHWNTVGDATNSTGFNLMGSGLRDENGTFSSIKDLAYMLVGNTHCPVTIDASSGFVIGGEMEFPSWKIGRTCRCLMFPDGEG